MRRALLGLSLLFLAATTAVAQVGTLDGYVNVSLSGDEATVTSNLYMLGSGSWPSYGTANPSLTIAALALRTAETISKELTQ